MPYDHGGQTSAANLHAVCRHHHRLKQSPGWAVKPAHGGAELWITPTGRRYASRPHDYGETASEADPDPPF